VIVAGAEAAESSSKRVDSSSCKENTTLLGAPTTRSSAVPLPGEVVYFEGLQIGYRAFGEGGLMGTITPLFPFGHGLSYTTFEYGPLEVQQISKCSNDSGPRVSVRVSIRNSGKRSGAEVAQVYSAAGPSTRQPAPGPRALCAFKRTADLAPGEEERIIFELDARALGASFSTEADSWIHPVVGNKVDIEIGGSSTDVRGSVALVLE